MMIKRVRSVVCIGVLLFVSLSSVLAIGFPVSIQIHTTSETIQAIRYQIGSIPGKSWKSVPGFGHPLVLEDFDSETEYLFVQQSEKENIWDKITAYTYEQEENAWKLVHVPTKYLLRFRIQATNKIEPIFRYQHGTEPNKPWKIIDASGLVLAIEEFDSAKEFLFVQQSYVDDRWSETYVYQYDKEDNSWNLATYPPEDHLWFDTKPASSVVEQFDHDYRSEPESLLEAVDTSGSALVIVPFTSEPEILFVQQAEETKKLNPPHIYPEDQLLKKVIPQKEKTKLPLLRSFDLKAYTLFPFGTCSTSYSYLIGGGVQANISLGKYLWYAGLTFSKGPPKNNWVKSQQAFSLAIGFGHPHPLSEKMTLIPEFGYGVIFHLFEGDFDNNGINSLKLFIDQQVRFALYLTYAINERKTLFIAPLGVLFFEKEHVGIMYGCQAGIRFSK